MPDNSDNESAMGKPDLYIPDDESVGDFGG